VPQHPASLEEDYAELKDLLMNTKTKAIRNMVASLRDKNLLEVRL